MTGSQLIKWQHPGTGVPFRFEDRRSDAKTTTPDDNDTLAAFEIISKALAETPRSRRKARSYRTSVQLPRD
jgi:hypothetical protein